MSQSDFKGACRRDHQDPANVFAKLAESFSIYAGLSGIKIQAYHGDRPYYFSILPAESQVVVLDAFRRYVQVAEQMINLGESLAHPHRFLWRMIQSLGLHPTDDLFGVLEGDDVIEIYSVPTFVQIFRSLSFFSKCSYTLDEILARPYWDLYHRDDDVSEAIMVTARSVTMQTRPETVSYDIRPHYLSEISGPKKLISRVENKYISPLLDAQKRIVAVVNVMSGHVCGSVDGEIHQTLLTSNAGKGLSYE